MIDEHMPEEYDPTEDQLTLALADVALLKNINARQAEVIAELNAWVDDLQAGQYVNCVYCGHRYGPDDEVPVAMADMLKAHIEECPKHPLSECRQRVKQLELAIDKAYSALVQNPTTGEKTAYVVLRAIVEPDWSPGG